MESEALAVAMERLSYTYARTMVKHWEGSRRVVMAAVSKAAKAADALFHALAALGPRGQAIALGREVDLVQFILYEEGEWVWNLVDRGQRMKAELDDKPWAGRPAGETSYQTEARALLLGECWAFLQTLESFDTDKARKLVPELARAVHRVVIEPKLPKNSQLFNKEWDRMRAVQK